MRDALPVGRPGDQETRDLGGAMSGGARMLACRNDGAGTTTETGSSATRGAAGAASAAETARQALRHVAWSMPSPQQSLAGTDMPMLSQGTSPDCAHTLAAGPK